MRTKFMLENAREKRPGIILSGRIHGESYRNFFNPKRFVTVQSGKGRLLWGLPVKSWAMAERRMIGARERKLRNRIAARKKPL